MKFNLTGILYPTASLMLISGYASAQGIADAERYGIMSTQGTARSIGFGNALGSVGGDFASLSVNPAGIGIYRSSEFMFSPSLNFSDAKSTYADNDMNDNHVRFSVNNLGLVLTDAMEGNDYKRSSWKSVSFGIGINRTANFNRSYTYGGNNNTSSGSQYFEADAMAYPGSTTQDEGTPAYLGYQSYLLASGTFQSMVPYQKGVAQLKSRLEKGSVTEMVLTLGGNYEEKLLLGATLGIPILNYNSSWTYDESLIDAGVSDSFSSFSYNEKFKTTGAGVNLKLGMIYKFSDYFRMGAAIHTPTIYSLKDVSSNGITTDSRNFAGVNTIVSPENVYEYQFLTPFKGVLSATAILGQYGFFTVDYEYVNYGGMRYYFEDDKNAQTRVNRMIKDYFTAASNIRTGLEIRLDNLMLRGGFGYYGSPYADSKLQSERIDISGGIGYRMDNLFVDFALMNSSYSFTERPYELPTNYTPAPQAKNNISITSAVFTIGVKM